VTANFTKFTLSLQVKCGTNSGSIASAQVNLGEAMDATAYSDNAAVGQKSHVSNVNCYCYIHRIECLNFNNKGRLQVTCTFILSDWCKMSTHGKKTILLVEDDSIQSIAVEARMKLFGYEVITVDSGEKAVELALNDQTIDLILMDIMLGDGIDGTDAAKQILAKRDVAIVFLSSYSDRNTIDKVRGITRYGYLLKNSDDFVLESSIEMAFELFDAHQRTIESEEKYSVAFHTSPDAVNINSGSSPN